MLLRRQFRYCVTSLADVGEESITTQYYSFLSSLGGLVVERLNCSICTTQKFHLLFVVLLERRDKKNHIFQLSPRFPFHFPDDDQNYTDTYEKRSNEISNVRTFGASVRRLLFSHFCVVLWLVLRKKLRLVHLILKKKRRTRDFGLWVEAEQKLGKVLLFWFSINLSHFLSIFPNPLRSSNNGNTPPAVLMYLTSRSSCRSIKSIWGIWVVWRRLRRLRRKWSQSVFFQRRSFEKNLTGQNGEV